MRNYTGPLDVKKMDKSIKKIYMRWGCQRSRCNNPRDKAFKYYGEKGIRVEYSSRDFIDWFLNAQISGKFKNPVTGRVDHSKNYSFDNIEMIEWSDNSKEAILRSGNPRPKRIVHVFFKTNEHSIFFDSIHSAAAHFGRYPSYVYKRAAGKIKSEKDDLSFSFV